MNNTRLLFQDNKDLVEVVSKSTEKLEKENKISAEEQEQAAADKVKPRRT